MKATIDLIDGVNFEGFTDSGHKIDIDGPPEHGGRNLGARPMELVLLGMGACTAFDVVHILRKSRHEVTGCRVELEADRADQVPKVFTDIRVRYFISGQNLQEKAVKRAVELSAEKYCSASIMLGKTANITHHYQIVAPE
jgi:putative redox protein